jgi:hypothetical protein
MDAGEVVGCVADGTGFAPPDERAMLLLSYSNIT